MSYGTKPWGGRDKVASDKQRRQDDEEEVEVGEEETFELHEDCAEMPELAALCDRCRTLVHRAQPRKKDTKRWCRGKVGVEHKPEWVSWNAYKANITQDVARLASFAWRDTWRVEICTVCKKELRHDFPWGIR